MNERRTGWLMMLAPVVLQAPYGMLVARFEYPAILEARAEVILEKFWAGGWELVAIWLGFALAIVPMGLAIGMYERVPRWARWMGVASAVVQMVALLRWVVIVPVLAAWQARGVEMTLWFNLQHLVLGRWVGEFLGQVLLAGWTWAAGGRVAAVLFAASGVGVLVGRGEVGVWAFGVWSLWCVGLGWRVGGFAAKLPWRHAEPAAGKAMENGGLG